MYTYQELEERIREGENRPKPLTAREWHALILQLEFAYQNNLLGMAVAALCRAEAERTLHEECRQ